MPRRNRNAERRFYIHGGPSAKTSAPQRAGRIDAEMLARSLVARGLAEPVICAGGSIGAPARHSERGRAEA